MVLDNMNHTTYHRMVCDAAGPEFNPDEEPNAEARNFYDMIRAGDKPVYEGNSKHTQLSAAVRMLEIKCRHRCSQAWFDDMSNFIQELLPQDNLMPLDFYNTKKLVRGLGLPVQVIHCYVNSCMIYCGDDSDLNSCKKCGHTR